MSDIRKSLDIVSLYEADEHLWAKEQIDALTSNQLHRLDRKHLAEYLTEMTQRDHRELQSRMEILLIHLLKIGAQSSRYGRSWRNSIVTQQKAIPRLLSSVPSLNSVSNCYWEASFQPAVKEASILTNLPQSEFPTTNPWSFEQGLSYEPPQLP